MRPSTPDPGFRFTHADRLHGRLAFARVFGAKLRKHGGPLTLFSLPNEAGRHRLGLSVPRRVGKAVRRARVKRMLREAFRLHRHDWPGAYDLVVVVRPHEPLTLPDYARLLSEAAKASHANWSRRKR